MAFKTLIYKLIFSIAIITCISACELTNLNVNIDPNSPSKAEPRLLLPSAQINLVSWMQGLNADAHGFVGILSSNDNFGLNNTTYNNAWGNFYTNGGKDLDELIKGAERAGNLPHYLGIGQTMKAYFFGVMVDMFGDVPYSEAFGGNLYIANKNPKFDKDVEIYEDLIKLCDQAISNLSKSQLGGISRDQSDIIYEGDINKWLKLANTVKFRLLINARRVRTTAKTEIEATIKKGLISSSSENFKFTFNSLRTPDGRHPWAQSAYSGDNQFTYFLHQFMVEMIDNEDPRLPYYFRRQTSRILNQNDPTDKSTTPCIGVSGCTYGYLILNPKIVRRLLIEKNKVPATVEDNLKAITDVFIAYLNNQNAVQTILVSTFKYTPEQAKAIYEEFTWLAGYFGRDRGDFSGVPPDANIRTAPGVYPAGGVYDGKEILARAASVNEGKGQGYFPMITNWQVNFLKAEAILTLGIAGDARQELASAMRSQMVVVESVAIANDNKSQRMNTASIERYINNILDRFDKATTNEQKLNVVLKQAWFSNFGNGFEIYNAFRRTGYPNDIQLNVMRPPRQFALRLPYPQQELTYNPNAATYKDVIFDRDAIFWDILKYKLPL